jgi:hypothetical protein
MQFAAGVADTGGKFAAGVVVTGGNLPFPPRESLVSDIPAGDGKIV